jgi:hypothetical protein
MLMSKPIAVTCKGQYLLIVGGHVGEEGITYKSGKDQAIVEPQRRSDHSPGDETQHDCYDSQDKRYANRSVNAGLQIARWVFWKRVHSV